MHLGAKGSSSPLTELVSTIIHPSSSLPSLGQPELNHMTIHAQTSQPTLSLKGKGVSRIGLTLTEWGWGRTPLLPVDTGEDGPGCVYIGTLCVAPNPWPGEVPVILVAPGRKSRHRKLCTCHKRCVLVSVRLQIGLRVVLSWPPLTT
jgi:hypothetical protein